jgi:salicylate hydroxylase
LRRILNKPGRSFRGASDENERAARRRDRRRSCRIAAAIAIARNEFDVQVFEQARDLREVGAGISITPNGVKVLRALGLEDALRARGFESEALIGRDWTTAQPVFCMPLKDVAAARYGTPNINFHRADLLDILATSARLRCRIHLDSRCVAVSSSGRGAIVTLSDGRREEFDLVGCDGIHSVVREALHGRDAPRFRQHVLARIS